MRQFTFIIATLFIMNGCASKKPDDVWKFYATSYFATFKDGKLKAQEVKANTSYQRAVNHAKSGTHFETLKRIYLGKCALNIALLNEDTCTEYKAVADIDKDEVLDAYYHFLIGKSISDRSLLPKQYQKVHNIESVMDIEPIVSKFVVASQIKEQFSQAQIDKLIDEASLYGYKALVIAWLEYGFKKFHDVSYKEKIEVLTNPQ